MALPPAHPSAVLPRSTRRDVCLGADDGLYAVRRRLFPKVVRTEHVAVVSHGDRGHLLFGRRLHQRADPRRSVQHGVLTVHVQMHERIIAWWQNCLRLAGGENVP